MNLMKQIKKALTFSNADEINLYYKSALLEAERLNKLYNKNKETIFSNAVYDAFYDLTGSIYKKTEKIISSYKKMNSINSFNIFLEKNLNIKINTKEYDELYLEIFDTTINELNILSNLVSALMHFLCINKKTLSKEVENHLFCLYLLSKMLYSNIAFNFNQKVNTLYYLEKGITYIPDYDINIDIQFKYIINKMKEIKIIEEIKKYFYEEFGEDYFILKMIQ